MIDQPHHRFDDVVDVSEIPAHVAVVEQLDRRSLEDRLREDEHRHVRPAPGTVHGKEAQAGRGNSVEMAVGVRHQLVGFLRRSIEADRMIDVVLHRERQLGVGAIDRR